MKIYGLVGQSLVHSFSQKYFSDYFIKKGVADCQYLNFELKELDIEIIKLKNLDNLCGLNVTIPFKTKIISFLDDITDACKAVNACNCIKIENGKWIGYNTDVVGFEESFIPHLKRYHKKALVLGTGGASKAVIFVLNKLGIKFLNVSRNKLPSSSVISYADISPEIIGEYNIVINTTPLGMFPKVYAFPQLPYEWVTPQHYFFDLIYNPTKTLFLAKAEAKGAIIENGQKMLEIQAIESWKIWNS
jgi:shikimate dehydrogenase